MAVSALSPTLLPKLKRNVVGKSRVQRSGNPRIDYDIFQIHAVVARGTLILAEHSGDKRDFSQGMVGRFPCGMPALIDEAFTALQTILSKIPPNDRSVLRRYRIPRDTTHAQLVN